MRSFFFFFFQPTATTEIYTLSLHDALPISEGSAPSSQRRDPISNSLLMSSCTPEAVRVICHSETDRKSTRLNSSHTVISYAVFCLKKKKENAVHESLRTHVGTTYHQFFIIE